jgi:hypothetical protein
VSSASIRNKELQRYKTVRQQTIAMAEDLTQEGADFRPASSSWSPGEILDHLIKSQNLYQAQFERLAAMAQRGERPVLYLDQRDIDLKLPFIPSALMPVMTTPLALVNAFLPSVIRETMVRYRILAAENPSVSQPRFDVPIGELRAALRDSMAQQERFFAANPDLPYDTMRLCHAALGNNNVPALLRICLLHEQRHQDQLAGLLKYPRFPKIRRRA